MEIEEMVTRNYDDVLSKFKHISSLSIDKEEFIKMIKMADSNQVVYDKDIARAHQCFIGDIITTSIDGCFGDALTLIKYPKFKVKTYIPNPYYYFKDNYSLEKSVMMLKKDVLNLIINDNNSKLDLSSHVLNILQLERINIEPIGSFYTLRRYAIGAKMFYNLYNKVVLKNRGVGMPMPDEKVYLDNLAIDQGLLIMEPLEVVEDGEFVIKASEYAMFKKYIKDRYKIEFSDEFIMPNGEKNTVWLYKDIERYDNRSLVEVGHKMEVLPLSYQRKLKK